MKKIAILGINKILKNKLLTVLIIVSFLFLVYLAINYFMFFLALMVGSVIIFAFEFLLAFEFLDGFWGNLGYKIANLYYNRKSSRISSRTTKK